MLNAVSSMIRSKKGQAMPEYAALIAAITLVAITAAYSLGASVSSVLGLVADVVAPWVSLTIFNVNTTIVIDLPYYGAEEFISLGEYESLIFVP